MIQIKDKKECCGCGACANICPQKCITLMPDEEGFLYPVVDKKKCTNCGLCEKICPIINKQKDDMILPQCYACYNIDDEILLDSSSGGVFHLLAESVINNGGIVYGAKFESAYKVVHARITTVEEMAELRKSKYLQSEIRDVYTQVKQDLQDGKTVLFSGTECQIAGLKKYLVVEYDNLYTQGIICHGVPSQYVWEKYLRENKIGSNAIVNFRHKSNGWENYSVFVQDENIQINTDHSKDCYIKSFLSDCNIRPSCYDCKFKTITRYADITLADFWGVSQKHNDMNTGKGTSAVMIHSEKGKNLFDNIANNLVIKPVLYDDILKNNTAGLLSAKPHKNRNKFFNQIKAKPLKSLVKKYIEPSLLRKLLTNGKKVLNKITRKLYK